MLVLGRKLLFLLLLFPIPFRLLWQFLDLLYRQSFPLLHLAFGRQENKYKGNVIDNGAVLLGPAAIGFLHQGLAGILQSILLIVRDDQAEDLVIGKKLPDSIRSEKDELVVLCQLMGKDLWLVGYTDGLRDVVAQGSTHCKSLKLYIRSKCTFLREPDS